MLKETHKQIYFAKAEHAPATKSTAGYNYCLSPRTTPSYVKQRLANNSTGEAEKKTKLSLSTTNKGTKIKTDFKNTV